MSAGLSNPKRSAVICIALLVIGVGGILWGVFERGRLGGGETGGTGFAIVGGLLLAIIGFLFLVNFIWLVRRTSAMKRGENVIARWTVPQQTLEEFRQDDADPKKMRRKNDYRLPRKLPPEGLEVIFSADAVMIGDAFFGLARSGIARFTDVSTVPGNPLSVAFRMAVTAPRGTSYGGATLRTRRSELRVPVARTASTEASKVLAHYTAVQQGRIQVKPKFWARRIRIGWLAAAIGAASFAAGMTLNALKVELGLLPFLMAVIGGVVAPFGLIVALIASRIRERERSGR